MRRSRRWILAGAALALAGSGIGVAQAGDGPAADDVPYFPAVQQRNLTPENRDPDLAAATIDHAALVCRPDHSVRLQYRASVQPGAQPQQADGRISSAVTVRALSTYQTAGGSGEAEELPMQGDSMSTGDAPPSTSGWQVIAGDVTVAVDGSAPSDGPATPNRVRLRLVVSRWTPDGEVRDIPVSPLAKFYTDTHLAVPAC